MMNHIKIIILYLFFIMVSGCEPFAKSYEPISNPKMYEADVVNNSSYTGGPIKVVTWNIRFGAGRLEWIIDSCGDHALADYDSVKIIMQKIADTLNAMDADIVLLQEVDIESKRSGFMDQVQFLLDNTNLNFGAYAPMMEVDFVFSDGLGRINTGNAILSRYDLTDAERIKLRLRGDQSPLIQYGYARRNIIKAKLPDLVQNDKEFFVVNIHATAFATDDTKEKHIERYLEVLNSINGDGHIFVSGGDLNSIPTGSIIDFCANDMCPNDENDYSIQDHDEHKEGSYFANFDGEPNILDPLYTLYQPAIDLESRNLPEHFTHAPSTSTLSNGNWRKYDRKLDYLFTNKVWQSSSGKTHQKAWQLSDHMPVSGFILLNGE
ncbi:MAG: hypothetical protein CMG55_04295 [Candidatus Marinimicrobia bacterium]|nr:hypothetical protein [Candidatus Neomarinimicrobiota bacterium]|tara:strand:+ start:1757 stop:2890 length:1134 start_codon:yes stop_codon:yes gene_type:complete